MPRKDAGAEKSAALGSLASREAAFAADPDISERHAVEKRKARLRIAAKVAEYWAQYKDLPLLKHRGLVDKKGLTDAGARRIRSEVVRLLREAPLTHGFNPGNWFDKTHDVGTTMRNCWHLNLGSGMREKTESHLFRYGGEGATPQMKAQAAGGKNSATFSANSRPLYAALNYSGARYGGSSGYGKTHFVLRDHLRFNATFTSCDSFGIESKLKENASTALGNYHNVYPIIIGVPNGALDRDGVPGYDVLKSMIDHALGLIRQPPMEEFDGKQYVEAQIPGDLQFARDIERMVVDRIAVPPDGAIGKRCKAFAKQHRLAIDFR